MSRIFSIISGRRESKCVMLEIRSSYIYDPTTRHTHSKLNKGSGKALAILKFISTHKDSKVGKVLTQNHHLAI